MIGPNCIIMWDFTSKVLKSYHFDLSDRAGFISNVVTFQEECLFSKCDFKYPIRNSKETIFQFVVVVKQADARNYFGALLS